MNIEEFYYQTRIEFASERARAIVEQEREELATWHDARRYVDAAMTEYSLLVLFNPGEF